MGERRTDLTVPEVEVGDGVVRVTRPLLQGHVQLPVRRCERHLAVRPVLGTLHLHSIAEIHTHSHTHTKEVFTRLL